MTVTKCLQKPFNVMLEWRVVVNFKLTFFLKGFIGTFPYRFIFPFKLRGKCRQVLPFRETRRGTASLCPHHLCMLEYHSCRKKPSSDPIQLCRIFMFEFLKISEWRHDLSRFCCSIRNLLSPEYKKTINPPANTEKMQILHRWTQQGLKLLL